MRALEESKRARVNDLPETARHGFPQKQLALYNEILSKPNNLVRRMCAMNHWQERITTNPQVCHGKPCIRGTRIMVSVILDNLAEGLTADEIVRDYPPLTPEDVRAALAYAAVLAGEEELVPLR
jgi:uncharacterized protein (DUF433 family)